MSKKNTLNKRERLAGENRIGALFEKGRGGGVGPLRFKWLATPAVSGGAGCVEQPAPCRVRSDCPPPPHGGNPQFAPQAEVAVLFSVPKKFFRRAWRRNLLKRRMREAYRTRKHALVAAAQAAGVHLDIALICVPAPPASTAPPSSPRHPAPAAKNATAAKKNVQASVKKSSKTPALPPTPPDFKTIDDAIEKILAKVLARI